MTVFDVRPLTATDAGEIAAAFAELGWPGKDVAQYERYFAEQQAGDRAVFVAFAEGRFAGYTTVVWQSHYEPFRQGDTPEISDLNVLPQFRRRGIASALMDAAETLIATRSATAGLGVGLYPDYSAAHAMYLQRGYRPDGRGVAYAGKTVAPGDHVRVDDDLNLMMTRQGVIES